MGIEPGAGVDDRPVGRTSNIDCHQAVTQIDQANRRFKPLEGLCCSRHNLINPHNTFKFVAESIRLRRFDFFGPTLSRGRCGMSSFVCSICRWRRTTRTLLEVTRGECQWGATDPLVCRTVIHCENMSVRSMLKIESQLLNSSSSHTLCCQQVVSSYKPR